MLITENLTDFSGAGVENQLAAQMPDSPGPPCRMPVMAKSQAVIPVERVASRIYLIRGEKVMLDSDLAELYGVPTSRLSSRLHRPSAKS
jgi:hypothetical protein